MLLGPSLSLGSLRGASAPSEFSPKEIPGLLADLDARYVVQAGGVASKLLDQSGNGFDATAPAGNEPTYVASKAELGGKPALHFPPSLVKYLDQTDDAAIAAAIAGDSVTIFEVGISDNPVSGFRYHIITRSGTRAALLTSGGDWGVNVGGSAPTWGVAGSSYAASVFGCAFSLGANQRVYWNARTSKTVTTASISPAISAGFRIGNVQTLSAGASAGAHITRVIVYKGQLTQPQCEAVLNGLGAVYGITIAT